ncbi:MAG: tRNA threonylcarbamoyladenosine dehydratase [Syntrophomonadaceae bacterium]|jgi:tRNA A37 threonylcarbamoyladenosine dehydratase|nr:tRNA threonylcarbamoyladenosine dehydratase [Syntrophomonadaceae bacterium]
MESFLQRTSLLIGDSGIQRLQNASVIVIGLGGVGSYAAEALARNGIGHMTLVDRDQVEATNINRQLPALHSTIGRYKCEVMAERILDINPGIELRVLPMEYTSETADSILDQPYDYVLDAIDSLTDKIHLIKHSLEKGLPIISAMGAANRLDPLKFQITDISNTHTCPMARKVRRELRQFGIVSGVPVVYSTENPHNILDDRSTRLGSVSFVPGTAGLAMAGYVINSIWRRAVE